MNALSQVELWLNNDECLHQRVNDIVIEAWGVVQQTSVREDPSSRTNECMFLIRAKLEEIIAEVRDNIIDQLNNHNILSLVGITIFLAAIDELDLTVLALRLLNGREDDYREEYGKL